MDNQPTKQKNLTVSSLVIGSALCLLAGAGINNAIERHASAGQATPVGAAAAPAVTQGLPDFASLAKRVGPSVVNVATTQIRKNTQGVPSPFDDDDPLGDDRWLPGIRPDVGPRWDWARSRWP